MDLHINIANSINFTVTMTAIIIGERVKIIQIIYSFYHISKRHTHTHTHTHTHIYIYIYFKGYLILSIQLVTFEGAMVCSNLINQIVSVLNL